MNFWDRNAEILKERYKSLYELLNSIDNEFPYEVKIETAPTGDLTLNINGIYIHSPRDPAREGKKLAISLTSLSEQTGCAPIIVLGFGLGYFAREAVLIRGKSNRCIIIAEKHLYLLRLAFEKCDFTDLLSSENIMFIAGGTGDGIIEALNISYELNGDDDIEEKNKIPSIIRNRGLIELDSEWYKNIEEKIKTYSMKDKVNTATLKRFGKRWVKNIAKNMEALRDLPGVERILTQRIQKIEKESYSFPVFLAAAGPSLDKIKPYLKDIYARCIIVSVDTNMRFFTDNGIAPDFVLTVDPQFWNSRHLDRCTKDFVLEKTAFVIESAVYPSILNLPFKRRFMCGSLFPLSQFIEMIVDVKGRLAAGGSVATTAYDFAKLMHNEERRQNIWIAGLDLAFPDYKTHFKGARFEVIANSESNRFKPSETWVLKALREGGPFKAKSSRGGQILTDTRLSLYAAWFENQFSQNKNIKNIALFSEGLAINGLETGSIEEFLSLPVCRDDIDSYLNNLFNDIDSEFNNKEEKERRNLKYKKAMEFLLKALNSIKKTAQDGIANESKDLDKLLKKIQTSDVKEIVSFLIPMEENINVNPKKLFNDILESAEYHLKLLENGENNVQK